MDKKTRIIFIVADGVGDLGNQKNDGKTPLQKANIPYINAIAQTGLTGLMDSVEAGLGCGTDTAHMNIFGYNPFKHYRGRGCFETLGAGIPMDMNEIGFKCNFSVIDQETQIVVERRVDRDFDKWGLPLIDVINNIKIEGYEDYTVTCIHSTEHRCGLKVKGPNLVETINGTDPLKDNLEIKQAKPKMRYTNDENSIFTAKLINQLHLSIHKALENHPINIERGKNGLLKANMLTLRGCGKRLDVQPFFKQHNLKAFMIAPTAIVNGLGQCLQMDIVEAKGATGDYHSNISSKGETLIKTFQNCKDYDFGFIHVKGVDDAGHDKNYDLKIQMIEKVEKLIEQICINLETIKQDNEEFIIAITGDHTTPIKMGDHTHEPIPIAMTTHYALANHFKIQKKIIENKEKLNLLKDKVEKFNEIDCASGCLGRFNGSQLIPTLKKLRTVVDKYI